MATTCPQCGQSLDQDFGVVSCPNCHSVLVFDLDGNVAVQDASFMSQEIHDASETEEPVFEGGDIQFEEMVPAYQAQENLESVNEVSIPEIKNDLEPLNTANESELSGSISVAQSLDVLDQPIESEEPLVVLVEEEPFIGEPTIPLVNTSGSVMSYHLKIEGIDTKDMRSQVEQALGDSKFPWTAKEIIRQTKDGILEIGPMNPVVASVLVRRLKDLSLHISWRQNIYEN